MDINADFDELIKQMDKLALELELPDMDFEMPDLDLDLAALDTLDLDLPVALIDFDEQSIKRKVSS